MNTKHTHDYLEDFVHKNVININIIVKHVINNKPIKSVRVEEAITSMVVITVAIISNSTIIGMIITFRCVLLTTNFVFYLIRINPLNLFCFLPISSIVFLFLIFQQMLP